MGDIATSTFLAILGQILCLTQKLILKSIETMNTFTMNSQPLSNFVSNSNGLGESKCSKLTLMCYPSPHHGIKSHDKLLTSCLQLESYFSI